MTRVTDPDAPPGSPSAHLPLAGAGLAAVEPVDGWTGLFGALADANRLRILVAIHHAPGIRVSDIAAATGMTDNATSHALAALRVRGLVTCVRRGRERLWELQSERAHALLHWMGAQHSVLHPEHALSFEPAVGSAVGTSVVPG
jgi:DNA-binding transcriptional ArsR family regulator